MKHKRPPIPVLILLALALLTGGYFGIRALLNPSTTMLTASGTIEAIEVTISPEIGGKVSEVTVDEGALVKTGDVLFRLDDTLIQGQRAVAAASLEFAKAAASTANAALVSAQANYDLALNAARLESAATRTLDWAGENPAGYTLPGGYFSRADDIAAARAEVDVAGSAYQAAQNDLQILLADPANVDFVTSERQLADGRAAFFVAQDVLQRASAASNSSLREAAQTAFDEVKAELEADQAVYDGLKDTQAGVNIISARADLALSRERLESARDRLLGLQTGENSPKVAAAQAVFHQARAAADQADLVITQAEASLRLIDIQITRLTITSPADGTLLTSSIQPGEIVAPNAVAMTLGRLDNLTITVYVPENLYGGLSLGQSASMTVDSFPGETFSASVNHIADQAEFTPRNVQTIEGRTSMVFAIQLQVLDPNGKLKPGMPADVVFGK